MPWFVGQPAIADVLCNCRAVSTLDVGTAALQLPQSSVVVLVPLAELAGNGTLGPSNGLGAGCGNQGKEQEQVSIDHSPVAEVPSLLLRCMRGAFDHSSIVNPPASGGL